MSEETPAPLPTTPIPVSPRAGWFTLSSPIGLIGAFTAVVEVALIAGVAVTNDPIARMVMILFAAAAFFFVAYRAFWLLEHLPVVLYAPKDYGGTTTIENYSEATNRNRVLAFRGVKKFFATEIELRPLDQAPEPEVPAIAEQTTLGDDFVPGPAPEPEQFREGEYVTLVVGDEARRFPYFLDVKTDEVEFGELTKRVRYDPNQWIGEFIIEVSKEYRTLGYFSSPESYGLTWSMRDRKSGVTLDQIGFIQEFGHGYASVDRRTLQETEVLPGMELEPVQLPPPAPPATSPYPWLLSESAAETSGDSGSGPLSFDEWVKSEFGFPSLYSPRSSRRLKWRVLPRPPS